MINIRTIKKLADGDGLTLKNGKIKRYKSGYQVATNGVEVISPEMAIQAVREFKGTCGVWLENGRYYIDISKRVSTKREAVEIGKNAISFQFTDGVEILPAFTFNSIWG